MEQCNDVKFEDLYETVKGMSRWQRMLLVDEFLHDASDRAFELELNFRQFVQQNTRHMGEYDEHDEVNEEDCDDADNV